MADADVDDMAAVLRDAALALRDARGDEALVGRLRDALARVDPEAAADFEVDAFLRAWRRSITLAERSFAVGVAALARSVERHGGDAGAVRQAARYGADLARARAMMARVARLVPMGDDALRAEILPVGTPVTIRDGAFATTPETGPHPAAGTSAVVVSYAPNPDRPLLVAPAGEVADDRGGVLPFDEGRPSTFGVSLADVDVAGPALLVGHGRNDGFGFVATHVTEPSGDAPARPAMLVEAAGLTWQLLDARGKPDLVCALPAEEDFTWLSRMGTPMAPSH